MLEFILNIICDVIHDVFIKQKNVDFLRPHVPAFIEPENCPTNSPDLNPVDYCIWGALQQLVYQQQIQDIEHLKDVRSGNKLGTNQPGLY